MRVKMDSSGEGGGGGFAAAAAVGERARVCAGRLRCCRRGRGVSGCRVARARERVTTRCAEREE